MIGDLIMAAFEIGKNVSFTYLKDVERDMVVQAVLLTTRRTLKVTAVKSWTFVI